MHRDDASRPAAPRVADGGRGRGHTPMAWTLSACAPCPVAVPGARSDSRVLCWVSLVGAAASDSDRAAGSGSDRIEVLRGPPLPPPTLLASSHAARSPPRRAQTALRPASSPLPRAPSGRSHGFRARDLPAVMGGAPCICQGLRAEGWRDQGDLKVRRGGTAAVRGRVPPCGALCRRELVHGPMELTDACACAVECEPLPSGAVLERGTMYSCTPPPPAPIIAHTE